MAANQFGRNRLDPSAWSSEDMKVWLWRHYAATRAGVNSSETDKVKAVKFRLELHRRGERRASSRGVHNVLSVTDEVSDWDGSA